MRRGRSLGAVGEPVLNPISFELHADRLGELDPAFAARIRPPSS